MVDNFFMKQLTIKHDIYSVVYKIQPFMHHHE